MPLLALFGSDPLDLELEGGFETYAYEITSFSVF
jgi:hypothetical protein